MKTMQHVVSTMVVMGFWAQTAAAQSATQIGQNRPAVVQPAPAARQDIGPAVAPGRDLPPAQSSHDPLPTAPSPVVGRPLLLVRQAGVGGDVSYARGGVMELGGSVSWSKIAGVNALSVAPMLGWFVTDNLELSAILQVQYMHGSDTKTFVTALIEPSLHIPLGYGQAFLFGGLGVGVAYHQGFGSGVAIAPRAGFNILVGRSGILTPSATFNWASNAAEETSTGVQLAVHTMWGANIGYSVMW
jgi:hypothetical protein